DGTLDTSFSSTGYVVHNNAAGGNGDDWGFSITTDSSGRILVAGYSYNGSNDDMVIWRYK
ncbi:MAG: SBBP repeat-containing protein, partial [Candidatus Margulisiibacteriota bacterium]